MQRDYNQIRNLGFTLIELLVVMVILTTVGSLAVVMLSSALRGANKTETINKVRQSGNYATLQLSKQLQYSECINGLSLDGSTYTNSCTDGASYTYLKYSAFGATDASPSINHILTCSNVIKDEDGVNAIDFLDSGLTINCHFACSGVYPTSQPTINISFTLSKAGSADKSASIDFNTSITPRNGWCNSI
jgi:prepilin-type N-terminal cleavage/methylation domain-containing protein